MTKCSLSHCLSIEDGSCSITVPTMLKEVKPGNVLCKYYSDDAEAERREVLAKGGLHALCMAASVGKAEPTIRVAGKDYITKHFDYDGYVINRMKSKSYQVIQNGKEIPAKNLLIKVVCHFGGGKKEDWEKCGTRRIGNELMKLVKFESN